MANSPEEEEEEEAAAAAEAEAEIRLSPLHQLLSGEKSALWEPFRDTTEVQEQKLLRQLASEKPLRQRPSLSRHHLRQNGRALRPNSLVFVPKSSVHGQQA